MKKKSQKDNIPLRNHGFEELMEFYLDEDEKLPKNQIASDRNFESFKTFNHLELERERVQRLNSFISKKIPNIIEHNQSPEIISKFTSYNFHLTNEITEKINSFDSKFNKNICLLFNKSFRKK